MNQRTYRPLASDMEGIVRNASFYDWLIGRSRSRRRPARVPGHLHADLGLPSRAPQQDWSGWRPFG